MPVVCLVNWDDGGGRKGSFLPLYLLGWVALVLGNTQ